MGTIFVIGDTRRVLKHSRQLIPNPFKGHRINVLDKESKEIIKEFAQLDGAFLIREDGRIVAAGRYLEVEPRVIDLMLPRAGKQAHSSRWNNKDNQRDGNKPLGERNYKDIQERADAPRIQPETEILIKEEIKR